MPFWRKKDEGFEWNKYVRTTVLVRRKKRRQKIEDVGAAAAFGVRQAKWKSVKQAKAAAGAVGRGSLAAGQVVRTGSKAGWAYILPRLKNFCSTTAHWLNHGFWTSLDRIKSAAHASGYGIRHFLSEVIWPGLVSLGQKISQLSAPAIQHIAKPEVVGPLAIVAVVASLSAVANFVSSGFSSKRFS